MESRARRSDEDEMDLVFQALSDRTRRAIIVRLRASPSRISDLAEPFDMSLPAVSKHVGVLERAGLVRKRVEGRSTWCALVPDTLRAVDQWLEGYRLFWDGTLDALESFLGQEP